MKTFKTIEDYKKYTSNFYHTLYSNKDFLGENDIAVVFSSSINEKILDKQIISGEPARVGANICMLLNQLPKDLVKAIYKTLKKIK